MFADQIWRKHWDDHNDDDDDDDDDELDESRDQLVFGLMGTQKALRTGLVACLWSMEPSYKGHGDHNH